MPLSLFNFPRSRRSEPRVPTGTFSRVPAPKQPQSRRIPTRSDVAPRPSAGAREDRKSDAAWEAAGAEVYRITLPPGAPDGEVFPDLESALLAAADQLQRTPSQPELPPIADPHRRAKS
jgi:hypothetical protein